MTQQLLFEPCRLNSNRYPLITRTPIPVSFLRQKSRNSSAFGIQLQPLAHVWFFTHNTLTDPICESMKTNTKQDQNLPNLVFLKKNKSKTHHLTPAKSQVEEEAVQALCLLGTYIPKNDQIESLFNKHNQTSFSRQTIKKNKKKRYRKRSLKKEQFETIGTTITLKLYSPTPKDGSLKIKCRKGSPIFATPSTYPKSISLQIKNN
ncbi:hypothetical protein M0813_11472 [Anaeramoeba flamelloides]|uniref:Ribosomal protein S10 n=1 Tax=Anaeramoeba flamelloides TaxID=1746091 RepID=A0ABQ8ZFD4_9EUKA|nr:hypothetical protein M0813_11472 [Anaeramoeba flamelloides]